MGYLPDDFSCDCCDRFDDDYPSWNDGYWNEDYEGDHNYEDDYNSEEGYDYEGEFDNGDPCYGDDYSSDDRGSPSPGEFKPTVKQEDDKAIIPTSEGTYLPGVEEAKVGVKQEIKEEIFDRGIAKVEAPVGTVPPAVLGSAETGSGTGEQTSRSSGIGPDVQTEAKRVSCFQSHSGINELTPPPPQILRSHRSKPY